MSPVTARARSTPVPSGIDDADFGPTRRRANYPGGMTTPDDPTPTGTPSDPTPVDPAQPVGEVIDGEVLPSSSPTPGSVDDPFIPPLPDPDYTEAGVPTFDFVRDKIEGRISTAIGSQELAEAGKEGQQVDEMMRKRDEAAKKKLDEIRKSMGK